MITTPADPFRPHGWAGDVRGDASVYRSVQHESPMWPMSQATIGTKGNWNDRDEGWPAQCSNSPWLDRRPGRRAGVRDVVGEERPPAGGAGLSGPQRRKASGGWWRGRGGKPGLPVRAPRGGVTPGSGWPADVPPPPAGGRPITPNPGGGPGGAGPGKRWPGLPSTGGPAPGVPGATGGAAPAWRRPGETPPPARAGRPITPNPDGRRWPSLPRTRPVPASEAWGPKTSGVWRHWRGLLRWVGFGPSMNSSGAAGGGRPIPAL